MAGENGPGRPSRSREG